MPGKRSKIWVRIVSACVAVCFFMTEQSLPQAFALTVATSVEVSVPPKNFPRNLKEVWVPENIGKVEEVFQGDGRLVILVQDAHAIPDAQRNIRNLIDFFQQEYGLDTVAVEGSMTRMNPQIFRSFPDKELLRNVFGGYLESGELTGTAMAAIFNRSEAVYQGIEDWDLYEEGYGFYLESLSRQPEIETRLQSIQAELNSQKESVYSPALLKTDKALQSFLQGKMDLIKVLEVLASFKAPPQGSELALILDENSRTETSRIPVELEVKSIAEKVRDYFNRAGNPGRRESILEFNEKYQAFQTSKISADAFALFLRELCREMNLPFRFSADLNTRVKQQRKLQDIEGTRFFDEFERYAKSVKADLISEDYELRLDQESQRLYLLERLSRLELTRDQWHELKSYARGSFENPNSGRLESKDLQRLIPENDLREKLIPHLLFYENAESRDQVFVTKLLELKKERGRVRTSLDRKAVLLVAGGFHTEGLIARLKSEGASYLLLTPKINQLPGQISYQDHMRGIVSWKDYYEIEQGTINIYKAFVRYTRDRLVEAAQKSDPLQSAFRAVNLLKEWRDQIIRDLAGKGRVADAGQYTRFIDEVSETSSEPISKEDLTKKIDRFMEGLRELEARGSLNEQNILKLVQPAAVLDKATGLVLVSDATTRFSVSDSVYRKISETFQFPEGLGEDLRSETQAAEPLLTDSRSELRTAVKLPKPSFPKAEEIQSDEFLSRNTFGEVSFDESLLNRLGTKFAGKELIRKLLTNRTFIENQLREIYGVEVAPEENISIQIAGGTWRAKAGQSKLFSQFQVVAGGKVYPVGMLDGEFEENEVEEKRYLHQAGLGPAVGSYVDRTILMIRPVQGQTLNDLSDQSAEAWESAFRQWMDLVLNAYLKGVFMQDPSFNNVMVEEGRPVVVDAGTLFSANRDSLAKYLVQHIVFLGVLPESSDFYLEKLSDIFVQTVSQIFLSENPAPFFEQVLKEIEVLKKNRLGEKMAAAIARSELRSEQEKQSENLPSVPPIFTTLVNQLNKIDENVNSFSGAFKTFITISSLPGSSFNSSAALQRMMVLVTALQDRKGISSKALKEQRIKEALEGVNEVLKPQGYILGYAEDFKDEPLHLVNFAELRKQAESVAAALTLRKQGPIKKIFVAEDNLVKEYKQWGQELFAKSGIQVTIKENGQEGLEELRAHHEDYDLIISDVNMPEMYGPDMMNIFSEEVPLQAHAVPAIYITDVYLGNLKEDRTQQQNFQFVKNWENRSYIEKPAAYFELYTLVTLTEVVNILNARQELRDVTRFLKKESTQKLLIRAVLPVLLTSLPLWITGSTRIIPLLFYAAIIYAPIFTFIQIMDSVSYRKTPLSWKSVTAYLTLPILFAGALLAFEGAQRQRWRQIIQAEYETSLQGTVENEILEFASEHTSLFFAETKHAHYRGAVNFINVSDDPINLQTLTHESGHAYMDTLFQWEAGAGREAMAEFEELSRVENQPEIAGAIEEAFKGSGYYQKHKTAWLKNGTREILEEGVVEFMARTDGEARRLAGVVLKNKMTEAEAKERLAEYIENFGKSRRDWRSHANNIGLGVHSFYDAGPSVEAKNWAVDHLISNIRFFGESASEIHERFYPRSELRSETQNTRSELRAGASEILSAQEAYEKKVKSDPQGASQEYSDRVNEIITDYLRSKGLSDKVVAYVAGSFSMRSAASRSDLDIFFLIDDSLSDRKREIWKEFEAEFKDAILLDTGIMPQIAELPVLTTSDLKSYLEGLRALPDSRSRPYNVSSLLFLSATDQKQANHALSVELRNQLNQFYSDPVVLGRIADFDFTKFQERDRLNDSIETRDAENFIYRAKGDATQRTRFGTANIRGLMTLMRLLELNQSPRDSSVLFPLEPMSQRLWFERFQGLSVADEPVIQTAHLESLLSAHTLTLQSRSSLLDRNDLKTVQDSMKAIQSITQRVLKAVEQSGTIEIFGGTPKLTEAEQAAYDWLAAFANVGRSGIKIKDALRDLKSLLEKASPGEAGLPSALQGQAAALAREYQQNKYLGPSLGNVVQSLSYNQDRLMTKIIDARKDRRFLSESEINSYLEEKIREYQKDIRPYLEGVKSFFEKYPALRESEFQSADASRTHDLKSLYDDFIAKTEQAQASLSLAPKAPVISPPSGETFFDGKTVREVLQESKKNLTRLPAILGFSAALTAAFFFVPVAGFLLTALFLVMVPVHEYGHYFFAKRFYDARYGKESTDKEVEDNRPGLALIGRWVLGIVPQPSIVFEEKMYSSREQAWISLGGFGAELVVGAAAVTALLVFQPVGWIAGLLAAIIQIAFIVVPIRAIAEYRSVNGDTYKFFAARRGELQSVDSVQKEETPLSGTETSESSRDETEGRPELRAAEEDSQVEKTLVQTRSAIEQAYDAQNETAGARLARNAVDFLAGFAGEAMGIPDLTAEAARRVKAVWVETDASSYAQPPSAEGSQYIMISLGKNLKHTPARVLSSFGSEFGHALHFSLGLSLGSEKGSIHRGVAEAYDRIVSLLAEDFSQTEGRFQKLRTDAAIGNALLKFQSQNPQYKTLPSMGVSFQPNPQWEVFVSEFVEFLVTQVPDDMRANVESYIFDASIDAYYGFDHFVGAAIVESLMRAGTTDQEGLQKAARLLGLALRNREQIDFSTPESFVEEVRRAASEDYEKSFESYAGAFFPVLFFSAFLKFLNLIFKSAAAFFRDRKGAETLSRLDDLRDTAVKDGPLVRQGELQQSAVITGMMTAMKALGLVQEKVKASLEGSELRDIESLFGGQSHLIRAEFKIEKISLDIGKIDFMGLYWKSLNLFQKASFLYRSRVRFPLVDFLTREQRDLTRIVSPEESSTGRSELRTTDVKRLDDVSEGPVKRLYELFREAGIPILIYGKQGHRIISGEVISSEDLRNRDIDLVFRMPSLPEDHAVSEWAARYSVFYGNGVALAERYISKLDEKTILKGYSADKVPEEMKPEIMAKDWLGRPYLPGLEELRQRQRHSALFSPVNRWMASFGGPLKRFLQTQEIYQEEGFDSHLLAGLPVRMTAGITQSDFERYLDASTRRIKQSLHERRQNELVKKINFLIKRRPQVFKGSLAEGTVSFEGIPLDVLGEIDLENDGFIYSTAFYRNSMYFSKGLQFTIDALGVGFDKDGKTIIHDPLNGRQDYQDGILRFAGESTPEVIERYVTHATILRAIGLANETGFQFSETTAKIIEAFFRDPERFPQSKHLNDQIERMEIENGKPFGLAIDFDQGKKLPGREDPFGFSYLIRQIYSKSKDPKALTESLRNAAAEKVLAAAGVSLVDVERQRLQMSDVRSELRSDEPDLESFLKSGAGQTLEDHFKGYWQLLKDWRGNASEIQESYSNYPETVIGILEAFGISLPEWNAENAAAALAGALSDRSAVIAQLLDYIKKESFETQQEEIIDLHRAALLEHLSAFLERVETLPVFPEKMEGLTTPTPQVSGLAQASRGDAHLVQANQAALEGRLQEARDHYFSALSMSGYGVEAVRRAVGEDFFRAVEARYRELENMFPDLDKRTKGITWQERLVPLHQPMIQNLIERRQEAGIGLEAPLVVMDVGIGKASAPTTFRLLELLREAGFTNVRVIGIDNQVSYVDNAQAKAASLGLESAIQFELVTDFDLSQVVTGLFNAQNEGLAELIFISNVLLYYKGQEQTVIDKLRQGLAPSGLLVASEGPAEATPGIDYAVYPKTGEAIIKKAFIDAPDRSGRTQADRFKAKDSESDNRAELRSDEAAQTPETSYRSLEVGKTEKIPYRGPIEIKLSADETVSVFEFEDLPSGEARNEIYAAGFPMDKSYYLFYFNPRENKTYWRQLPEPQEEPRMITKVKANVPRWNFPAEIADNHIQLKVGLQEDNAVIEITAGAEGVAVRGEETSRSEDLILVASLSVDSEGPVASRMNEFARLFRQWQASETTADSLRYRAMSRSLLGYLNELEFLSAQLAQPFNLDSELSLRLGADLGLTAVRGQLQNQLQQSEGRPELRAEEEEPNPFLAKFSPPEGEINTLVLPAGVVDAMLPQMPLAFEAMAEEDIQVRAFGGAVRGLAFATQFQYTLPISEFDLAVPGETIYGDKFEALFRAQDSFKEKVARKERARQIPMEALEIHPTPEADFNYILRNSKEWSISKFWLEYDAASNTYQLKGLLNSVEDLKARRLRLSAGEFLDPKRVLKLLDQAFEYLRFGFTLEASELKVFEDHLAKEDIYGAQTYNANVRTEALQKIAEVRKEIERLSAVESKQGAVVSNVQELLDFAFASPSTAERDRLINLHRSYLNENPHFTEDEFIYVGEGPHFITYFHHSGDAVVKAPLRSKTFPVHYEHLVRGTQIGQRIFAQYGLVSHEEIERQGIAIPEDLDQDTQNLWVVQHLAFSIKDHLLALKDKRDAALAGNNQEEVGRIENDIKLLVQEWRRLMYRAWAMGIVLGDYTFENTGVTSTGRIRQTGVSFDESWDHFFKGSTSMAILANNANQKWLTETFGKELAEAIYGEGLNQYDFDLLWPAGERLTGSAVAEDRRAPFFENEEALNNALESFWKSIRDNTRSELRGSEDELEMRAVKKEDFQKVQKVEAGRVQGRIITVDLPVVWYHGTNSEVSDAALLRPGADGVIWFASDPNAVAVTSRSRDPQNGKVIQAALSIQKIFVANMTGEANRETMQRAAESGVDAYYNPENGHLAYIAPLRKNLTQETSLDQEADEKSGGARFELRSSAAEADPVKFAAVVFYLQMARMTNVGESALREAAGIIENTGVQGVEAVFRRVSENENLEGLFREATRQVLEDWKSDIRKNIETISSELKGIYGNAYIQERLPSGLIIPKGFNPGLSNAAAERLKAYGVDEIILSGEQVEVTPFRQLFSVFRSVSASFFNRPSVVYENLAVAALGDIDFSAFHGGYYPLSVEGLETIQDTQKRDFFAGELVPDLTGLLARILKANSQAERSEIEASLIRALGLVREEKLISGSKPNIFILNAAALDLELQWRVIRLVAAAA